MLPTMPRIVFLASVLTAIVSAATVVDFRSRGIESPAPRPVTSPTSISAPGVVEGATEAISLRPEVTGVVVEQLASIGDRVLKGQPLLRLDDRTARLTVQSAQAQLASAVAQRERLVNGARSHERDEAQALQRAAAVRLSLAATSLARVEQLETQRAVAEQEADDARSSVDALRAELAAADARLAMLEAPAREDEVRLADARIAAAQAAVESAQVALDKTLLRAPCDAQVLDINVEVGELIAPTEPEPVLVLADTSRLRVRAFVEELDAPRVALGAPVTITADGLQGRSFTGAVAALSPRMSTKHLMTGRPSELYDTKVREVLVDVDEGADLIVGLRVDVSMSNPLAPEPQLATTNERAKLAANEAIDP